MSFHHEIQLKSINPTFCYYFNVISECPITDILQASNNFPSKCHFFALISQQLSRIVPKKINFDRLCLLEYQFAPWIPSRYYKQYTKKHIAVAIEHLNQRVKVENLAQTLGRLFCPHSNFEFRFHLIVRFQCFLILRLYVQQFQNSHTSNAMYQPWDIFFFLVRGTPNPKLEILIFFERLSYIIMLYTARMICFRLSFLLVHDGFIVSHISTTCITMLTFKKQEKKSPQGFLFHSVETVVSLLMIFFHVE